MTACPTCGYDPDRDPPPLRIRERDITPAGPGSTEEGRRRARAMWEAARAGKPETYGETK